GRATGAAAARCVRVGLHRRASPIRHWRDDRARSLLGFPPHFMQRFWALPLRRQLFLAVLLLLVPVLGAVMWSGLSTYRERLDELGDQTRVVALTTAAAIDREL